MEEPINRITKSFSDAIKLINQIQKEIEKKKEEAMKLQKDIQHYKQIMKLKKPEVDAIVEILRKDLQKESEQSFWNNFLVDLFFFRRDSDFIVIHVFITE